ncbi:MAG: DNA mismatch repair protein MutS [Micavibrio aeruginosavorus]|uniref:DNA mismatch repair protein MutS n=1 Tax=Micavibrio aeruginosavorus TaxID=349221 RepID=A0A2W4ZWE7_9BACT|nr:MAG: DNA mismatch repair protein MutS [Micavibrio aeruginosavorus]
MVKKTDKAGKGKRSLSAPDFRLWHAFTRDIEPLSDVTRAEMDALLKDLDGGALPPAPSAPAFETVSIPLPDTRKVRQSAPQEPQLDARTEARLRRGKMPIEATLDLHGYNQEQAHVQLNRFVMDSYRLGRRCVLVITGKGSRSGGDVPAGVLKQKLPLWLSLPPLRDVTLKVFPAVQRDGGTGASYIYLKRQREPQP